MYKIKKKIIPKTVYTPKPITLKDGEHSLFSPSSAKRWLSCSNSLLGEPDIVDTSSKASERGSMLHEVVELCLLRKIKKTPKTYTYNNVDYTLSNDEQLGVLGYVDYCSTLSGSFSMIESKLNIIDQQSYGTADYIKYDDANKTLHVVDYKSGRMFVDTFDNPQLKLYAFGAVKMLKVELGLQVKKVHLHIYQPQSLRQVKAFKISAKKLSKWINDTVVPVVENIVNRGEGVYNLGIDNCRYCDKRIYCTEVVDRVGHMVDNPKEPSLLDVEELMLIIKSAYGAKVDKDTHENILVISKLEHYYNRLDVIRCNLEPSVRKLLQNGADVTGYKLIMRGGTEVAVSTLTWGKDVSDIYKLGNLDG